MFLFLFGLFPSYYENGDMKVWGSVLDVKNVGFLLVEFNMRVIMGYVEDVIRKKVFFNGSS